MALLVARLNFGPQRRGSVTGLKSGQRAEDAAHRYQTSSERLPRFCQLNKSWRPAGGVSTKLGAAPATWRCAA